MHNALIVLGLGSIFLLSMGFLSLAFLMNRQWSKDLHRRPADDE
jgi:hypothetical protein